MRPPDFFLVGAPKCGTTALYAMLGAHPGIFASKVKEPDFFAADVREAVPALAGRALEDWSEYLELFSHARPDQRAGEGSVSYLASRMAAAAIQERCPDARIIMVLRDPADRLFSHYSAARAAKAARLTFHEWLDAELKREAEHSAPIGPIVAGRYGLNLQRYLDVFPGSRVHIVWYEEFEADPASTLREVFTFLGVEPSVHVPVAVRLNETRVPRWPQLRGLRLIGRVLPQPIATTIRRWLSVPSSQKPTAGDRALVTQLYKDEIQLLARLTGRDLGHWIPADGIRSRL